MSKVIDILAQVGHVSTITLASERNYVYPFDQVKYLNEISDVYVDLLKRKKITRKENLSVDRRFIPERFNIIVKILNMIKSDPVGAYLYTVRRQREEEAKKQMNQQYAKSYDVFIKTLEIIKNELESTQLIKD